MGCLRYSCAVAHPGSGNVVGLSGAWSNKTRGQKFRRDPMCTRIDNRSGGHLTPSRIHCPHQQSYHTTLSYLSHVSVGSAAAMADERTEYPAMLVRFTISRTAPRGLNVCRLLVLNTKQPQLQPPQAVDVLNDRMRQVGRLNTAIADWLQVGGHLRATPEHVVLRGGEGEGPVGRAVCHRVAKARATIARRC